MTLMNRGRLGFAGDRGGRVSAVSALSAGNGGRSSCLPSALAFSTDSAARPRRDDQETDSIDNGGRIGLNYPYGRTVVVIIVM